jgi:ribonucleoside-diphosphate reductase alpha chain
MEFIMKRMFLPALILFVGSHGINAMNPINYHSTYKPSGAAEAVLRSGKIIASDETPQMMMQRVVSTLFAIESKFNTDLCEINALANEFGQLLDNGFCVLSTPILTNAGRYNDKPLSACTVPAIDLRKDMAAIKADVDQLHQNGMGTGFNLDDCADPIRILKELNKTAIDGAKSGKEDRPVGNIAILSVYHPQIEEFIEVKSNADKNGEDWKFNISVNVDDAFMKAFESDSDYLLKNGKRMSARRIMEKIAHGIYVCADPGLIFLDRVNYGNPTPAVGNYISVAPCGEVGLAAGESCQFGYMNVAKFFVEKGTGEFPLDLELLKRATQLMVRALDNALEISIERYSFEQQKTITRKKRKIGIGICGLADLFMKCGLSYADPKAINFAQNIVSYINYQSKIASYELAKIRGSFEAINLERGCRYNENPGYIEQVSGKKATALVSGKMWLDLAEEIRKTKCLRNASTIALPPTGRSALLIDASYAIEPQFSLKTANHGSLNADLEKVLSAAGLATPALKEKILKLGSIGNLNEVPLNIRVVFKTANELSPQEHLAMLKGLQEVVDESISKTINTVSSISEQEILAILHQAYADGLKGITIYRDGSRNVQPHELGSGK